MSVHDTQLVLMSASHTSSGRFTALPKVKTEMAHVANIADKAGACHQLLSEAGATNEEMSTALESASIVHIACHGSQNVDDPLQSAFHLSDSRKLTVSDLMELDLKRAHLAFLSACETAKGDKEQPDQAIHLAATMLFVGLTSVVGTMWCAHCHITPADSR
jgi:CHAT domain-containing protein